ncbi:unnamed protein product [Microthlaspi erraticum]|uniref:CCHC-type domain-containing protein n=1 Tax=Microthlaspi erraticum TaxID=1685480 RepID=A0A6D2ICL1_9BRAS|nr:unnamed protein product [Microthlaspi erraticum]
MTNSANSGAENTTVFNHTNPSTTLININMVNVTKITHLNYVMWSRQIQALLEGHELHGFLEETNAAPSPTITVDGQSVTNPDHAPWRRQDRLLYSALIGAISLPVQSVVSTATTTSEIWSLLATTYGKPTRGHIRQLKLQIKTCVKGTKSISEYLRIIKGKADDLALLGKPVDPEDFTEQILAGLSEDYKPEIDAINGRDLPISFAELHERLLNREAMIMCKEETSSVAPITANAADVRPRQQQHQTNWRNNNYNNNNRQFSSGGTNHTSRPYNGRCQACGEKGHSAWSCTCPVAAVCPTSQHGVAIITPDSNMATKSQRCNASKL